ncbi:MAG: CNNM domain-containing protein [Candidatus Saelkia tenebricola]|nr:CNNM domain-containing protein [Candidatus Saelkia tenebricola]
MGIITLLLYLFLFLALAGFSSGYETGLMSVPVSMVEEMRNSKRRSYIWLLKRMNNTEKLVSITLVATNFALTGAVMIFLSTAIKFLKGSEAELLTVVFITPISIIFAEILPKSIFRTKPILVFHAVKIFQIMYYLMYPLSCIFYFLPSRLINFFTNVPMRIKTIRTKDQIKAVISKSEEKGLLEDHETTILYKVFDLGKRQVKEIMIPIKKVVAIDKNIGIQATVDEFKKYNFSRLPIYDKEKEEYIGLINYMDFLIQDIEDGMMITELIHPLFYVDDNTYLDCLLIKMLKNNVHMVGIRNSIGMVVGIVTLEDVMEEIVGQY